MAKDRLFSHAMFAEKLLHRTALGVFLVSIAYVFDVIATYAEGTMETIFDVISYGLGILVILIILPVFLTYLRHFRGISNPIDSFVFQIYRTACVRAFEVTFISLIFLDLVISKFFPLVPAAIIVESVLALSLSVMSVTFLVLNRKTDTDEFDDDEWDEAGPL